MKILVQASLIFFLLVFIFVVITEEKFLVLASKQTSLDSISNLDKETKVDDIEKQPLKENLRKTKLADGCYHVYLDFGSNVGVQGRKLYEPSLVNRSYVAPYFDFYYGNVTTRLKNLDVCTFGFEPNPVHSRRLQLIETCSNFLGRRTKYFTATAVSNEDKENVPFFVKGSYRSQYWVSSLQSGGKSGIEYRISQLDIARFVMEEVKDRLLPPPAPGAGPPAVLMKIDAEGEEIKILPSLLVKGAFCEVDLFMTEFHDYESDTLKSFWRTYKNFVKSIQDKVGCKTFASVMTFDDEKQGSVTTVPEGCEHIFPANCTYLSC